MTTQIDMKPSWFVRNARRYRAWCNVTRCSRCNLVAKYEDMHPIDPCPTCGSCVIEDVGRWVLKRPGTWWKLWTDAVWGWELHPGAPKGGAS